MKVLIIIWLTVVRTIVYVFMLIAYPEASKMVFKEVLKLGWKAAKEKYLEEKEEKEK